MRFTLDNFDGQGPVDYSAHLDAEHLPRVTRRLNQPAECEACIVACDPAFVVPRDGARMRLARNDGSVVFTGYLAESPRYEHAGSASGADIGRYRLVAISDELLLDRKSLPKRLPFLRRTAGQILRTITGDLAGTQLSLDAVQDCEILPSYTASVQRKWSEHAAELALRAGAAYRAINGSIVFEPLGSRSMTISDQDAGFDLAALRLESTPCPLNDVTVIGRVEPRTYVRDYFLGDGYTLVFDLSRAPVIWADTTVFEDEFAGTSLNPLLWSNGSGSTAVVGSGKLTASGSALVQSAEQIEIAGGIVLQHGTFRFQNASTGILGGLYSGGLANGDCIAGFRVTPSGANTAIQAIVNGAVSGQIITTVAGHHYQFATRIYASQLYRGGQVFHSSAHPAGSARGGQQVASEARFVLEIRDIDPANPASLGQPSTVLHDSVLSSPPGWCTYALLNGSNLRCDTSFTRMIRNSGVLVRSMKSGEGFRTRLPGALSEGGECHVFGEQLTFLAAHVPESGEQIVVSYRSGAVSMAHARDAAAVAAQATPADDGVRAAVLGLASPPPRTTDDCVNAALALLDDGVLTARRGDYRAWTDFLPVDILPGDRIGFELHSAEVSAIVREVELEFAQVESDRAMCRIVFANDAANRLCFRTEAGVLSLPPVGRTLPGNWTLPAVTGAQFTQILASQVTISIGAAPPSGGGFEVRRTDEGWGPDNDRNLVGRYIAQSFTAPRLARSQSYYIRQYDSANPRGYSRDSVLLHVDWLL